MPIASSIRESAVAIVTLTASLACSSENDTSTRAASVKDCRTLCDLTPSASDSEANCAAEVLTNRNYPVLFTDECIGITETSECNACHQALGTTTEDCTAIRDACVKN